MFVKSVRLRNFRNYASAVVELSQGRTIIIGANAQGKSNFIEAIETLGLGTSPRAGHDSELVAWGANELAIAVCLEREGHDEEVSLNIKTGGQKGRAVDKQARVNGVLQRSVKGILGRLITVSFASRDLNLIRGGPKFRRDWIDSVICRLRPTHDDVRASYQKVVSQRNRLLKTIFERRKLTVTDADELYAWDKQLARYASQIIKQRLQLLSELMPLAAEKQGHLSGQAENLTADYVFRAGESLDEESPEGEAGERDRAFALERLEQAEEGDLARMLVSLLKERRGEEIARKQTLVGPHRDDIVFKLNGASASSFASQGQQRSLVLAIKLAELNLIRQRCQEDPVLLLDDVLAELDVSRQALLMSAVSRSMQTIITTTHLTSFDPRWRAGARVIAVAGGSLTEVEPALAESGHAPANP